MKKKQKQKQNDFEGCLIATIFVLAFLLVTCAFLGALVFAVRFGWEFAAS